MQKNYVKTVLTYILKAFVDINSTSSTATKYNKLLSAQNRVYEYANAAST